MSRPDAATVSHQPQGQLAISLVARRGAWPGALQTTLGRCWVGAGPGEHASPAHPAAAAPGGPAAVGAVHHQRHTLHVSTALCKEACSWRGTGAFSSLTCGGSGREGPEGGARTAGPASTREWSPCPCLRGTTPRLSACTPARAACTSTRPETDPEERCRGQSVSFEGQPACSTHLGKLEHGELRHHVSVDHHAHVTHVCLKRAGQRLQRKLSLAEWGHGVCLPSLRCEDCRRKIHELESWPVVRASYRAPGQAPGQA